MIANNDEYVCRLCGFCKQDDVLHIFSEDAHSKHILLKIQTRLHIQISATDPLPKYVCVYCLGNLDYLWEFYEHCRKTQIKLRHVFMQQYPSNEHRTTAECHITTTCPETSSSTQDQSISNSLQSQETVPDINNPYLINIDEHSDSNDVICLSDNTTSEGLMRTSQSDTNVLLVPSEVPFSGNAACDLIDVSCSDDECPTNNEEIVLLNNVNNTEREENFRDEEMVFMDNINNITSEEIFRNEEIVFPDNANIIVSGKSANTLERSRVVNCVTQNNILTNVQQNNTPFHTQLEIEQPNMNQLQYTAMVTGEENLGSTESGAVAHHTIASYVAPKKKRVNKKKKTRSLLSGKNPDIEVLSLKNLADIKAKLPSGNIYTEKERVDATFMATFINKINAKYHCTFCSRVFKDRRACVCHVGKHINFYPYSCTKCDRRFTVISEANGHINSHSKKTVCSLCGHLASSPQGAVRHMKKHSKSKLC